MTTCNAAACLAILKAASVPIVAADLGRCLGLAGDRESQRRQVREIIKHLRDQGEWIVAVNPGGYLLTTDRQLWSQYLMHRQIDAKQVIGQSHNRNKAAVDSHGQRLLFQPVGAGLAPAP